jgi:hypothetical protein
MSTRRRAVRTTVPVVAILAVLLLGPSAAVADPPALNRDECSILLARAAIWPGGFEDESGTTVRLVSDAYMSRLSAQPPCSSPEG